MSRTAHVLLPFVLAGASLASVAQSSVALASADRTLAAVNRLEVADAIFADLALPDAAVACDVVVPLGGRDRTLRLWPHDVRAKDFRLVAVDGRRHTLLTTPPSVTMRGAVLGSPGSVVAGALVAGTFEGLVRVDGELFGVQPTPEVGPRAHAVYSAEDLLPADGVCGNDDGPASIAGFLERVRAVAVSQPLTFTTELALDCDWEFYQLNGNSTTATQNDVTNVLNGMDAIYGSQLDIDHVITTILVRTSSADPYTAPGASGLLSQFQSHWASSQQGVQRDAAHLFTGRNLSGSTIGIANISAVCTGLAYALSQSRFSGNFSRRVALTAHEIGHTMGATHCDSQSSCRIMCSAIAACGSITSFAPGPVLAIQNFRNQADCFDVSSPPILTAVGPSTLEALEGDELTLLGCHFSTLTSLVVGSETYSVGDPRVTVLGDDQLTLLAPTQAQLGPLDLRLTGPGGDSATQTVQVVPTAPPRLNLPTDSFGNFPLSMAWGSEPGDTYLIFYRLNQGTTFPFQGWDLLLDASYSGFTGGQDAAGVGTLDVVVPALALLHQTMYVQVALFDASGFRAVTNVASTYFQL